MTDAKKAYTKAPLDVLAALLNGETDPAFSKRITGDAVEFHNGTKIVLPKGMTYGKAYKILKKLEEDAEMPTAFNHRFMYRPDDGAYAILQVIKARYGMMLGKLTHTFFGVEPAEHRDIAIGVGERIQVPWGRVEIPIFEGLELVLCDSHADRDYGKIFEIHATGPAKYKDEMNELFIDIEKYLAEHSIYRGKAIIGSENPEFLDLSDFDPRKIIFSEDAEKQIDGNIHAYLKYSQTMRDENVPLKRVVLLEGPFGTGKTSEGQIAAGIATDNGWTFISARPGRDKVEDVLRTAKLYMPAVVFVEDIDNSTSTGEDDDVTKMLDAFDGITAKGGELMVIMTTNHVERIHKGMMRPGRLDAVIHIGELDAAGIERLIKVVVAPGKLDEAVDYKQVAESMKGFLPAYVRAAITRSVTFSINRLEGAENYIIGTQDLVDAALSLQAQLELQEGAGEGTKRPRLEAAFRETVQEAMSELHVYDPSRGMLDQPVAKNQQDAADILAAQ